MKKTLGLLIVSLCALAQGSYAQTITGQIIADQYQYRVQGYAPNTYTFSPGSCPTVGPRKEFGFFTGAPVRIVDGNPSLTEIVTPTGVINTNQSCAISIAPLNNHQLPWFLESGTGGLQEAIDLNTNNPQKNTIILDNAWYQEVGANAAAIIAAAKGTGQLSLQDVTQAPNTYYTWNGTQYVETTTAGVAIASYTAPGLVPGGICYVGPQSITTDAFAAINACGLTLPANGGTIDATGLGSANYTVTTPLTALNNGVQAVTLVLNPGTKFTINTNFGTPTNTPASCAVPVGPVTQPNGSSSIYVPGANRFFGNFLVGPNANVQDVICNGSFSGSQESVRIDGVTVQSQIGATVKGALMHFQGIFAPSRISNSGTYQCFAQCLEIDAGTGAGGAEAGAGNILFDNDVFADGYTGTQVYPGSVVKIDTLTQSSGIQNIAFVGGVIQGNGPFNQLLIINGRGSLQLTAISFIQTYFETLPAATSIFNSNVDPIQIADAGSIFIDPLLVEGATNPAAQANLVDITNSIPNQNFGININQLKAFTSEGYTCLIHNTNEGTCESGFQNGGGDVVLPNYQYGGQVTPQVRQTNVAPPTTPGQCVVGSIWTNSTGTGTADTAFVCEGAAGSQTYQAIGTGGGGGGGNVNPGAGYQVGAYPATGSTIGAAPGLFALTPSMTQAQINTLFASLPAHTSTVIIPEGAATNLEGAPAINVPFSFTNTNAQVRDFRKGADYLQITRYGVACDAQSFTGTITNGSNQINVGSFFGAESVGKSMVFAVKSGYGYGATQSVWTPTITAYTYPFATLSGNAPFSYTGTYTMGTLNTTALQNALNDATYAFPLLVPTGCKMLTGTLAWNNAQSIIGQNANSSGFIFLPGVDGLQAPDTAGAGGATGGALRLENLDFNIDSRIDATLPWTSYSPTSSPTAMAPLYRPLHTHGQDANNPLAIGWAKNATNGVASTTQNSAVICVPTALGRVPVVGQQIVFPYFASVFTSTVSSNTGSCSAGFTGSTMAAALPNTSGYTVAQAEWVSTTSVQTTSTTIPVTPTYPFTITLANSIAPDPSTETNVATHGHIKIGSTEFDYMGTNYYSPYTITIRRGPATTPGYTGTQTVVPLNPCSAKNAFAGTDQPWPVIPSINSGDSTPSGADWFPGLCGGAAAISFPTVNANTFVGTGLSGAYLSHLQFDTNLQGQNNTISFYAAGNKAPYKTKIDGLQVNGVEFGIAQGPASAGQHTVSTVGPTGAGNEITNSEIFAAYPLTFVDMQQSKIDRADTYSTLISPYDGTSVGTVTCLYMGFTLDERTGGVVTNTAEDIVNGWNCEPEGGTHIEIPAYAELDDINGTYTGDNFEGAFSIVGGGQHKISNTQFGNPVINYGFANNFDQINGLNTGYITNTWTTNQHFLNWGKTSNCSFIAGGISGAQVACGAGFAQPSAGHSIEAATSGNFTHPYENSLAGQIIPGEWNTQQNLDISPMQVGFAVDTTEPYWGSYAACNLGGAALCSPAHFDNFNGFIYIGPHNRIADAPYVLDAEFKTAAGPTTFLLTIGAYDSGNGLCPTQGVVSNLSVTTTTSWQTFEVPVDFTGRAGCNLTVQFGSATTTDQLRVGAFNFIPVAQRQLLAVASPTVGSACPVNGALLGSDASNLYICSASMVKAIGLSAGGGTISALTGDVNASGSGSVAATVRGINGQQLSTLATGLLQNTNGTGVPTIATNIGISGYGAFGGYVASGVYIVPCTTTPVFDLAQGNLQVLTLTTACGTVTSSSVTNLPSIIDDARHVTIRVCQDATGGHTFPDPTWATGWNSPTLNASQCTDTIYTASNTGMVVDGYNAAFCAVSGTSPLACGHAAKGYFAVPAGTSPTMTINTTAVGPNSIILFGEDESIGPQLNPTITCGTSIPTGPPAVTGRSSGANFTLVVPGTITGNYCGSYTIVNP